MTVFDNLAYPLREHTKMKELEIRNRILSLLEEFGLSGSENLFPMSLSGGMQKRVGLVRAIILEPEVILYDEPTAGLDPFNTRVIEDLILHLKRKGKSAILVTHDLPAAFEVCDRIAMLLEGGIGEINTVEAIKSDHKSKIMAFSRGELK